MGTPVQPTLTIRDLRDDSVVVQTSQLLDWSIKWALSHATHMTVEVGLGDPAAAALLQAVGGSTGLGPALPYLLELSLGGPTGKIDCRRLVDAVKLTIADSGSVSEDGDDIFDLYTRTGVDRVTFHAITIPDILNGAPGRIPVDGTGLILQGLYLPYQKGIFQTKPGRPSWAGRGRVVMTPIVDPVLRQLTLDVDLNADKISDALDQIMKQLVGSYFPRDLAGLGTRAHWLADSADGTTETGARLNLTGRKNGIACGFVGNLPHCLMTNVLGDELPDETTTAICYDPLDLEPATNEMFMQVEFIGGKNNHGLPDGASIAGVQVIRFLHGASSTRWDDSLLVVGVSTGNGGGGVYFYTHDGVYRPMSQTLDVNDLAYDPIKGVLYAGTDSGVYTHSDDPTDTAPWALVGGLVAKVTKIQVPQPPLTAGTGTGPPLPDDASVYTFLVQPDGSVAPAYPYQLALAEGDVVPVYVAGPNYVTTIVALVAGTGSGADGIYVAPGSGTAGTQQGFAGWSQIVASGSVTSLGATRSLIYYVDSNAPTSVQQISLGGSAGDPFPLRTDNAPDVTNLNAQPDSGYVYYLSSLGALGLFVSGPDLTGLVDANADRSLVDDGGNPVAINSVCENRSGAAINGQRVAIFACTDFGLFWSAVPAGGGWQPVTGQSAIDQSDVYSIAAGAPQTVLGRSLTRLYAAGKSSVFMSNTGGIWWRNILDELLDLGPFWTALAAECGRVPFPDNALANLGDPVGIPTEGTGTTTLIPATSPRLLPPGWVWSRRLDEHSDFTYRLVNLDSSDPHHGIEFSELNELQTNMLIGVVTASERLALAHYRWLVQASQHVVRLSVTSSFSTREAALRTLRPTDAVHGIFRLDVWGTDDVLRTLLHLDTKLWVLEHEIKKGSDTDIATSTTLATVLLDKALTESEMAGALNTAVKRIRRYRF